MEEQGFFSSLLNVNELVGSPLFVPLNLTNVVHTVEKSTFENVVNSIEKSVSASDISLNVIGEVVVPKANGTSAKFFAQVLSKTCAIIPHGRFPRSSLKGEDIAIKIPKEDYKISLESCKNHLHRRLILSKGDPPLKLQDLRCKLDTFWKPLSKQKIVSLGRGFYEFVFSSTEDAQRVCAALSWSLKPGFLKKIAWTSDFNHNNHKQTTIQYWVHFLDLPREYWSPNIIFAIASCLRMTMCLDATTSKRPLERSFGYFARVLVDIDLYAKIRYKLWVEREDYVFLINVEYENLPLFCSHCHNIGHSFSSCKFVKVDQEKRVFKEKHKCMGNKSQNEDLRKESVECENATSVDNNPLLGSVDYLKTTIDGNVVSIDVLHQGDLGVQGNENSCGLVDMDTTDQGKIDKNHDKDSDSDVQQVMNFLSESWANMDKRDEIVDLDENTSQPFQLVVPRKMKNKKKLPQAGKGFKVSASNCMLH
ncbi:unnamed protein product [Vicia faba]|uniref:DUF4283 domain-containing protein n=1 Tax=Vicia faba TaxID=3906 RepID=A0AAV0Z809_VICFA|nr:unnamed protein product [Vicia faba]